MKKQVRLEKSGFYDKRERTSKSKVVNSVRRFAYQFPSGEQWAEKG